MEVILTKPVERLGGRGALVRVADGYARNWLLPQGLATAATQGAKKQAATLAKAEARKEQGRRDAAAAERDKVDGKAITIRARATEAGKLYGSVTAKDICEALRQTHGLSVSPAQCHVPGDHLRDVGQHTVTFTYYHDIAAHVTVTLKALEEAAPSSAPRPQPIITEDAVED